MRNSSISKVIYLSIYIIIALLLSYVSYTADLVSNVKNYFLVLSIISIIQLLLNVFSLKVYKINVFSPIGFFVIFLYLFNFGQIFLKGFVPSYEFQLFDVSKFVPYYLLFDAVRYNLYMIFLLMIGVFLSSIVNIRSVKYKSINLHDKQYKFCKPIGLILLIISVPPMIYIDVKTILASITGAYHSIFTLGIPSIYGSLAVFFLPSVILLLFYYKENTKICRLIVCISIIYKLFSMLGGQRGYAMIFIIVLIYIYYKSIEPISIINSIMYGVLGFLILTLINTIKDIRGIQYKDFSLIVQAFSQAINNNVIFRAFEEFGSTLLTSTLIFNYYPRTLSHLYGLSYLASLLTIFPNIGGVVSSIADKYRWANQLSILTPGIGGSFIGELFVNFGYFSFFMSVVFGWILYRFSKQFEKKISNNDYFSVAVYAQTFCYSLLWIRGTFEMIVRNTVWTLLIIYGLYIIFKRK